MSESSKYENINELISDTGSWAEKTFPKSTELSVLKHMKEEFDELIVATTPENKAEEAADILLLLCHYCYKNNIDLSKAAEEKLNINKKRTWDVEMNDKGYFKHKEEKGCPGNSEGCGEKSHYIGLDRNKS